MSIQSNFPNLKPTLLLDFANTKQLDNRVTFTRSTPAVYYDGKTTTMAEQNMLTYSQNSKTNWSEGSSTATINATTAPDGTTTAISLVPNTTSSSEHFFFQPYTGTVNQYTHSVYAKPNGYNWIWLRPQIGGSIIGWANFNVSTGTIGSVSSGITATITSVGNGWYRCTATATQGINTNYFCIGVANADGVPVFSGDGTSGAYIWGAQLEQRSSATAYTATTTQPITNYIPVLLTAGGNQPRFDCNPTTGESLGLLIEEQRTNQILYSDAFATSPWGVAAVSIQANTIVSPNGTLTGDKIVEDTTNNDHASYQVATVSAGANTFSVYAKAAGRTKFQLREGSAGATADFDLSNPSANMVLVGNGWYRCSLVATPASTTFIAQIYLQNASGTKVYTGDGFSGIFIWGAQLEVGAFATSYIATTSASATRTADYAVMTGTNFSSWYNQGQGTIYAEGQINYNPIGGGGNSFYSIDDTSASTNVIQPYFSNGSGILFSFVNVNGVEQSNTGVTAISASTFFKHAQIYQTNNFASVVNNSTVSTDTSGITPVVTQLQFSNGKSKYFRKFAYYPLVVTTTQLQALTS